MPMRAFARYSMLYLALAMLAVELFRGDALVSMLVEIVATVSDITNSWKVVLLLIGSAAVASLLAKRPGRIRAKVVQLSFAVFGTVLFATAFGLTKVLMPDIWPYYADPALANFDKWLHGGIDPWKLSHNLANFLPMKWIELLYFHVWTVLTLFLPCILAVLDDDKARVRRFLILYAFSWTVIGNVFALSGLSVGPVFYDRLLGGDRFSELNSAIDNGVFFSPVFSYIQDGLWRLYSEGQQILGSGISAFPSVHVATSCVTFLYVAERLPWLTPIGFGYLVAIQFLSVYTGYHYAVDGYFSIIAVVSVWATLHRLERTKEVQAAVPLPAE